MSSDTGAGGSLRHPLPRRSTVSASPYSRPSDAARRPPILDFGGGGANGWISKLVDPASRFISSGAACILSSVLHKRITELPPPPLIETETLDACGSVPSNQEPIEVASFPSPVTHEDRDTSGSGPANTSSTSCKVISEFEQLAKKKTFTRSEFEHLTEILRSKIIDLDSKPGVSNEKIDDTTNMSTPVAGKESPRSAVEMQEHVILEDGVASPAELAKAYMSSKAKASFHVVSQQDQVFHDLTYTPKPFGGRHVIPRSANLYGTTDRPKSDYMTPRPPGRSAIYRMSRSPYFKLYNNDVKGSESLRKEPNIHQTPESSKLSGAGLALKQRSSALEYEVGSFGPLRRIRQKYTSPSKVVNPVGNPNERHANLSNNSICVNQHLSSETAKKIFQHLDEMATPPKDKSSKLVRLTVQDIVKRNGPLSSVAGQIIGEDNEKGVCSSGLQHNVVDVPEPGIENSLLQDQGIAKGNCPSSSVDGQIIGESNEKGGIDNSLLQVEDIVKGNGPPCSVAGQIIGESNEKGSCSSENFLSGKSDADVVHSDSNAGPTKKKPGWRLSVPKFSFGPETTATDGHSMSSSSMSMLSSSKEVVSDRDAAFSFPVAPALSSYLQPPPTPTMPRPVPLKSVIP